MPDKKKNNITGHVPVINPQQGVNPITGRPTLSTINRQQYVHTVPPQLLPAVKPRPFNPRLASGMSAVGAGLLYTKNPYLNTLGYILQLPDVANDYEALTQNPNIVTATDMAADVGDFIPQVIGKGDDIARGIAIAYDAYNTITGETPAETVSNTVNKKKRRHLDETQGFPKQVERRLESTSGKDR